MDIVNYDSLVATLDAVNGAFFYAQSLPERQREQAVKWIANRQGKPGSCASMFAPTEFDFTEGARLFTGETVQSRAGTSHILGEEACRALLLLEVPSLDVRDCLKPCQPWHDESTGRNSRRVWNILLWEMHGCLMASSRSRRAGRFRAPIDNRFEGIEITP